MSLKNMITKLALAFAAKKGMEIYHGAGGIAGIRDLLAGNARHARTMGDGMLGRLGGTKASDTGGLGNLLEGLGYAGASGPSEAGVTGQIGSKNAPLGALYGALATMLGERRAAVALPDAPGAAATEEDEMTTEAARAIVRAMVQVARADGTIDTEEESALFDIMADAESSERGILKDALRDPVDPEALAKSTPSGSARNVYAAALLLASNDNVHEQRYLEKLAAALRLREDEVNALRKSMGKTAVAS